MTEYVHVGDHADVLSSGQPIGPGDHVQSADLHAEDAYLTVNGPLVDIANFVTPTEPETD